MPRPQRNTQIPLRYRDISPSPTPRSNSQPKRPRIDSKNVDRNQVDQALAKTEAAPEGADKDEPPTLISTELPEFKANYVQNRAGAPRYTSLSTIGFFQLFFSDFVVEMLSEETNKYAASKLENPSFLEKCHWVPTTPAEILVFIGINLYFGLYPMSVRADYWKFHNLGQFMSRHRFELVYRFFSTHSAPAPPNAPWFYRIQRLADLIRTACRNSYYPSSYIAIDKAMVGP
ncbi:hypothetical protein GJ744_006420 [Endocarpon pusillum]|uniref:PiggyBac transposable element-derived protein domain-containing protein n=1 Tax=Endocarpon pusillum TaxID=364733 RepID=A0A8H7A7U5_9EURO|nr:hypothetical protein GJ744_006420 [Endocarpon pusillum]